MPTSRAPAKERLDALFARLSELQPKAPSSAVADEQTRIARLASLVFNSLGRDPRLVKRFVHELAKVQTAHEKGGGGEEGGRGT